MADNQALAEETSTNLNTLWKWPIGHLKYCYSATN